MVQASCNTVILYIDLFWGRPQGAAALYNQELAELVFRIVMSVQLQNGGDGILVESFYFWTSKLIIADTLIGFQTQTGANSSLSTWGNCIAHATETSSSEESRAVRPIHSCTQTSQLWMCRSIHGKCPLELVISFDPDISQLLCKDCVPRAMSMINLYSWGNNWQQPLKGSERQILRR